MFLLRFLSKVLFFLNLDFVWFLGVYDCGSCKKKKQGVL